MYQYSGLDKVASISEGEKVISSYQYSISGQLASATTDGATENFLWDGLALIRRGDTDYTNEPYVTGGNPVVAGDKVLFNDILGNTVGIKSEDKLKLIQMTAFGETADKDAFFTGKPAVNNLGYAFLFRNYRADQGKWQTSDPMGYPDGWNSLAYCNNKSTQFFDKAGNRECEAEITVSRAYIPSIDPLVITCKQIDDNNYEYTLSISWSAIFMETIPGQIAHCGCDGADCHGSHNISYNLIVGPALANDPVVWYIYTQEFIPETQYNQEFGDEGSDLLAAVYKPLNDWAKKDTKTIKVQCE